MGFLAYWWAFCFSFPNYGVVRVQEANDVVSRCCFTVRSTDNELRVIGYESQKMNSDYLCGIVPCMALLP